MWMKKRMEVVNMNNRKKIMKGKKKSNRKNKSSRNKKKRRMRHLRISGLGEVLGLIIRVNL